MTVIRDGEAADLDQIAALQAACPEAADWRVADYLQYDLRVALRQNRVAGFLVSRQVAPGEREILNLAVAPRWRRTGVARGLLTDLLQGPPAEVYLEVRESNTAARNTYKSIGFQEVGRRAGYYDSPPEAAIVMKFHSC